MDKPRRTLGRRILVRVVLWFIILFVMLRWFEYRQVFQPSRAFDATAQDLGRPAEDVYFEAEDGVKLNAWFFPRPRVRLGRTGYGCSATGMPGTSAIDCAMPQSSWIPERRSYSLTIGGMVAAEGDPPNAGPIWMPGLRMPGFAAAVTIPGGSWFWANLWVARWVPSWRSASRWADWLWWPHSRACRIWVPSCFPGCRCGGSARIGYRTEEKLAEVRVPVMVIHGPGDSLVPFRHAERNYAAVRGPKQLWTIPGDHNDFLEVDGSRYGEGLRRFMDLLESPPPR